MSITVSLQAFHWIEITHNILNQSNCNVLKCETCQSIRENELRANTFLKSYPKPLNDCKSTQWSVLFSGYNRLAPWNRDRLHRQTHRNFGSGAISCWYDSSHATGEVTERRNDEFCAGQKSYYRTRGSLK